MRKLLEILRLHYDHKLSNRQIEKISKCCKKTISKYIKLFEGSCVSWPLEGVYEDEIVLSKKLDPNFVEEKLKKEINWVGIPL